MFGKCSASLTAVKYGIVACLVGFGRDMLNESGDAQCAICKVICTYHICCSGLAAVSDHFNFMFGVL